VQHKKAQQRAAKAEGPLFMTFFEFADAVLAAALHAHPNPFLSVELRVEWYLSKVLFPGVTSHWNDHPAASAKRSEKDRQELISVLSFGHAAQMRNRMDVNRQRSLAIFQTKQKRNTRKIEIQKRSKARPSSASKAIRDFDALESSRRSAGDRKMSIKVMSDLHRPRSSEGSRVKVF